MKVSPELDVTAANIFIDDHPDAIFAPATCTNLQRNTQ
jgi:hypothetical protein